jgi:hypothetical protein
VTCRYRPEGSVAAIPSVGLTELLALWRTLRPLDGNDRVEVLWILTRP